MGCGLILTFIIKKYRNTYKIFVSDGISGMAVSCDLIQRTNLSLHVHPTGHSLAAADVEVNSHKKCSTTITYSMNIFGVKFLVAMHILFNTMFALLSFDLMTQSLEQ